MFALTWSDIDFTGNRITIRKSLEHVKGSLRVKDVKTKKSRRSIPLPEDVLTDLADHRKAMQAEGNYGDDNPVFSSPQGGHMEPSNFVNRHFVRIFDKDDADEIALASKENRPPKLLPRIRPYDLRHTAATLLLLAGVNAKIVSERLGHASVNLMRTT